MTADEKMNRSQYFAVWSRLFRDVPGPVALVWGLCAIGQFLIIANISGQPIDSFAVFIGSMVGLILLHGLQKGLYAPLRRLARSPQSAMTLASALGMSLRRLGAVVLIQLLIAFVFAGIVLVFVSVGAPLFGTFVVLQMFWFLLAPAVYFVAARGDSIFAAFGKTLAVGRRYLLWIVGVPALFWCVGAFLDEYVWSLSCALEAVAAGEKLTMLRALFLYLIYRYLRWLSVAALYVAVDDESE